MDDKIGSWAFLLAIVIAVVLALVTFTDVTFGAWGVFALVVLGLIVGFLNVTDKEIKTFLIAAIALVALGTTPLMQLDTLFSIVGFNLGSLLQAVVNNISVVAGSAALIVSLKAVYMIGKAPEPAKL